MQKRTSFIVLRIVGASGVLLALIGFWYNVNTFSTDYAPLLAELADEGDVSHFNTAFLIMSGVCVVFFSILLMTGVQLLRLKTNWAFVLLAIMVLEVIYFFSIGAVWVHFPYGYSVAAATGVSNGGLAFQAITGFVFWGPVAAIWARKSQVP